MAGCRGSLCCCCRWCCCCGERETRTPEELVRSGWSRAGEGAVAKGRREALPGVGPGRAGPAGSSGWGLGTAAWALEASARLHVPKSWVISQNPSLESEGEPRPASANPILISFYFHLNGVLNETSVFGVSPLAGLCAYHAAGLVFPALSPSIPHPFWVTDNPASLCKAPWENLSCCVPRVDKSLLISDSACYQTEPELFPP